jgi:hypothetical protein
MFTNSIGLFALYIVSILTISCSNTNKIIVNTAQGPKATVHGVVKNAETGDPIANAIVRVAGTTISNNTDESGKFMISVPRGYYKVQGTKEGYENSLKYLNLDTNKGIINNFDLGIVKKTSQGSFEQNYALGYNETVSSSDSRKDRVAQQKVDSLEYDNIRHEPNGDDEDPDNGLQKFIDHYINDDLNCKLVNADQIIFTASDQEGVQWVNDPIELRVMNYDLGYEIIVDLEEYISKEYSEILGLTVDAEYYFKEMTPENKAEAQRWKENRERYFKGSFRHFLIAMASEKSPLFFGYRLFSGQFVSNTTAMAYSSSSVSDIELEKNETFFPSYESKNMVMQFQEELRIEYVKKGIVDPDGIMGLKNYRNQTSWLSMDSRQTEFTKSGILKNPNDVVVKGVWRYTPVCKMLPNNYLPEIKK